MKIAQLTEAKYQQDNKPEFTSLTNEQIIKKFMHLDPELSDMGENLHFYCDKNVHIYDKGRNGGEVNWCVVYPPGSTHERGHPNEETWYFVVDHNHDDEWQTNPQKWQISKLTVLFDG